MKNRLLTSDNVILTHQTVQKDGQKINFICSIDNVILTHQTIRKDGLKITLFVTQKLTLTAQIC